MFGVVAGVRVFPLVATEVAELVTTAAGHVGTARGLLDDVLAVVALAVL